MADLGAWSQINCFENWSRIFKREIVKRAEEVMFAAIRHKFVCLIRKNFRSLMTYGQSEHSKICDCNFFFAELFFVRPILEVTPISSHLILKLFRPCFSGAICFQKKIGLITAGWPA